MSERSELIPCYYKHNSAMQEAQLAIARYCISHKYTGLMFSSWICFSA